jgi:hypothetical protein
MTDGILEADFKAQEISLTQWQQRQLEDRLKERFTHILERLAKAQSPESPNRHECFGSLSFAPYGA